MSSHLTAVEVAEAVRAGRLRPEDAVRSALDRIARYDAAIGAFQVVRAERAVREARAVAERPDLAQLPLAGVPIAIKDNVPVEGEPMRAGSLATSAEAQAADHPVVQRLRNAGAVVVGLTRTPGLCVFGATDSAYGITRNPWAPDRTAGGSSGGTAAAVAAPAGRTRARAHRSPSSSWARTAPSRSCWVSQPSSSGWCPGRAQRPATDGPPTLDSLPTSPGR